jgi:sigma-B regulation protein RsbU (phosphoserine phosphatase)
MFVTAFLGVLNLQTGELLSANCGHNPPILWGPGAEAAFMGPPGGPVLGIMEDAAFKIEKTVLKPGAVLLAFTDGVTEAFSAAGAMFSEDRLLKAVEPVREGGVRDISEAVLKEVDSFAHGAPQADDITILTLRFRPDVAPV